MTTRIGVVLSGCGFLDGAEIHESVLTLLHLDRSGAEAVCYAPRRDQMHVVNHLTREPVEDQDRSVMVEAARIARGKIHDLAEARAEDLDGLIMPGGFGAAKNLSNFAVVGADAKVLPSLAVLIGGMRALRKPIGAICISPAVLAAALRGSGVKVTLTVGEDPGTAAAIESMGAHHRPSGVQDFVVDEANKIVSTPAYMFGDARISHVSEGIEKLVKQVVSWAGGES